MTKYYHGYWYLLCMVHHGPRSYFQGPLGDRKLWLAWLGTPETHNFVGKHHLQMAGIFQHATEMISGENFNTDLGILVICPKKASSFYQTSSSFIATYPLAISDVNGKNCRKIIHE